MADYNDILRRAIQVRDAVLEGSNTASLVGGVMVDTLYLTKGLVSDINNIIDSLKNLGSSTGGSGSIDEEQLIAFLTTLQGYFTNGSAKKALQLTNARNLWGNSFNGTADINGSIIVPNGKNITIGNIKMEYDATNKALKITNTTTNEVANLYASGGISAYGVGTASSSGGGLNASVISYARIIEGNYTDADLTSIPNAYAIKALSSRIDNIATELGGLNLSWNNITGKPSTFAPSAHTHKWTEITDRITKVSQLTNDAGYLTAHQSLASYYTKAEIDAKGYTTNKGTVTSVALTLPTGLACATKTITTSGTFAVTFASGYSIPTTTKQTAWDGAVSAKHTHSNKSVLDGISSAKVTHWDSAYDWYALMTTDEETADGIINKWNEVVSFLANIAQTDTLSGIVDGINKSISDEVTRAKKAEGVNASGISTNKTNITTLQGYFTNGSAKKALQLTNARKFWGNSFNGTSDINGSIIVPNGKYISIGNIKMEYDATNKALKITNTTTNEVANLYTSGGVSAYGAGTSSSSGGGLNGSVKSYSDALKLASESLSEIASAYSIKALDSRISSLEGGSAMDVSVSGSGNAVTAISKSGTTIIVTKGTTFLTSHQSLASYLTRTDAASLYQPKGNYLTAHQSLDGYVNAITTSGSGNAITSVSKSGKGITFTKGATFLTSHQSLANYYTKSSVDSLLSGKSATSHTHSVKINGVTKTIAATGGTAVDLGTYLTSHQSLADYAKKSEIPTKVSQLTNDTGYITSSGSCAYATSAGNADKVDGVHANGLLTALSNSDKGISITVGGTTKSISNISVNYASSAGNADTVDGEHASAFTRIVGRHGIYTSETAPYNYIHLFRIANSNGYSTLDCEIDIRTRYHSAKIEIRISTAEYPYNNGGSSISIVKKVVSGRTCNLWVLPTVQSSNYNYYDVYYESGAWNSGSYGITLKGNNGNLVFEHKGTNLTSLPDKVTPVSNNIATSATKLATARSIWGQSFDGTGNVNGTIYINNSDSENGAIILNNNVNTHARISAIKDQVVFNTGAAIRFGATNWEYSDWAGLKYDTVANAIYLGIADGTVFNYYSNKRSNGTLKFPGITTITPDSGARIGGSGANLFLGNANNSAWVKVQDICSQTNSSLWSIRQDGNAYFKNIYSGAATINGNLSVDGLISNKGILPANYEFNNKGTSCYVSADALCSGITAITDSIQINQVTVQYSNDSGNSWTNYHMGNDAKFNLYASNAGLTQVYLGYNVITGNNDAEKLAQVKKNELMVTFEISNNCYSQVYFASVDISNGIDTICTVECLNNSGAVVRTYTKHVTGWNQVNYINISEGNAGYGLGSDSNRYIRFRFKHDQKTTALRNASINKIRIFAFTKYSFPTDRFMGHTGHIYNFDYNMNTYFPNSILAKGGVTAYQSSDIRLKQDLRKLDYLGIIKAMGGTFSFAWKKDNTRSIGWIAQHVLCNPQLKDIVETDEKGYYKINYWSPKLIATAFGAIEQVGDEVSRLKARVVFLESEVQRLSGDKEDCNKKRLDNKNINSLN